jgi:hypothetical protein
MNDGLPVCDAPWWLTPLPALRGQLEVGENGLTTAQARMRLARFGPNRFQERK